MSTDNRHDAAVVRRLLRLSAFALLALLECSAGVAAASAAGPSKLVRYRGYKLTVPAAWPVYDLASDPTVCVRFDRHAVYLGRPSSAQSCPAHAVGRTEAILVEPVGARRVVVIHSAAALEAPSAPLSPRPAVRARSAAAAAGSGGVYTGLGFDVCSAPSTHQMSAWGSSPYRAVGIYVGGANMACSQGNLTTSWVSTESAAGWHLIPTYVGLQAPSNSCGCQGIQPSQASAEGTAAAQDAIGHAQAIGITAGNPIYFDLEAYGRGATNTSAVLKFLSSWTTQLHSAGYKSGVYSSADSGIRDLVAQYGTAFPEPDDIWIASWNGQKTTGDPNVPSGDWASHQRLHQYQGGHDETHGGVTINIDNNYLDGATAGAASSTPPPPVVAAAPAVTVSPSVDGTIRLRPSWGGTASSWQVLGGETPSALAPLGYPTPSSQTAIAVHSAFPYYAVQALDSNGQVLATSQPTATPAHIAIYGKSAFSPKSGLGGVPAGCFTASPCYIATTVSAGGTVIATTGEEFIPAGGAGVLYFKLSQAGRTMLAQAPGHHLSAQVTSREASGATATTTLNLIRFVATGRGPRRSLHGSPTLRIVGATDFVSNGEVGGILAGCFGTTPCQITTTIASGTKTIARTGTEFLGANQLGYLSFTLTRQGHAMLVHAPGNQLAARVTIANATATASGGAAPNGGATASGRIALVGFH